MLLRDNHRKKVYTPLSEEQAGLEFRDPSSSTFPGLGLKVCHHHCLAKAYMFKACTLPLSYAANIKGGVYACVYDMFFFSLRMFNP